MSIISRLHTFLVFTVHVITRDFCKRISTGSTILAHSSWSINSRTGWMSTGGMPSQSPLSTHFRQGQFRITSTWRQAWTKKDLQNLIKNLKNVSRSSINSWCLPPDFGFSCRKLYSENACKSFLESSHHVLNIDCISVWLDFSSIPKYAHMIDFASSTLATRTQTENASTAYCRDPRSWS